MVAGGEVLCAGQNGQRGMSQRRKLQLQLRQLADIRDIMDAMKNLSLVEVLKLKNRLVNQQRMVLELERMAADFLSFYPYSSRRESSGPDIWILFGSERGFCGDFNEAVTKNLDHQLQSSAAKQVLLLSIGGKLTRRLEDHPYDIRYINGADVAEDIGKTLNGIVGQIGQLQSAFGAGNVYALFHHADSGQVACNQLIPPFQDFQEKHDRFGVQPILNIDPADFFISLVDDYLYVSLHEIACMSLLSENYQRIQHMTVALQRLDEQKDELRRHYHIHRQEEITEELEVILLNTTNV